MAGSFEKKTNEQTTWQLEDNYADRKGLGNIQDRQAHRQG